MKKIFIALLLFSLSTTIFSQKSEGIIIKFKKSLEIISDSMKSSYSFFTKIQDSINLNINQNSHYISFDLPKIDDEKTAKIIAEIIDSMAATKIYFNKVISNGIALRLIKYYSDQMDSNYLIYNNNHTIDWRQNIIEVIINCNINNCLKIISDPPAIYNLPKKYFSVEMVGNIKKVLINPYLTINETKILSQKNDPILNLRDTIGYSLKIKRYNELINEYDKYSLQKIETNIYEAHKVHLTLKQYYDSINTCYYKQFVNNLKGTPIPGCYLLLEFIGENSLYDLAPIIDSLSNTNLKMKLKGVNWDLLLARLRYKEKPLMLINSITKSMDSIIIVLNTRHLENYEIHKLENELYRNYKKLKYINTQEAYSRLAPLLLIKINSKNYNNLTYSIGAHFFMLLNENIINLPWNKLELEIVNKGEPGYIVDEWYIDNKMPKDFLQKMNLWMIYNKGQYLIVE